MRINKIGLRTIKTGLAIGVTLFVCEIFKITNPFFAAIAALFAMESSISATFTAARDRMYGTVLGAIVAIIFSTFFPVNAFTIGLGIVLVIYICNLFKWQGTIKISSIVFLAILLGFEQGGQLQYALFRTVDTFVGVSISTLINYFVFPFDVGKKIEETLNELKINLDKIVVSFDNQKSEIPIEPFENNLNLMKSQFELLKKEVKVAIKPKSNLLNISEIVNHYETIFHHLKAIDSTCEALNQIKTTNTEIDSAEVKQLKLVQNYHIEKLNERYRSLIDLQNKDV